jgi:hypothetical protein
MRAQKSSSRWLSLQRMHTPFGFGRPALTARGAIGLLSLTPPPPPYRLSLSSPKTVAPAIQSILAPGDWEKTGIKYFINKSTGGAILPIDLKRGFCEGGAFVENHF